MIQIRKWSASFESADTRKRQRLGWFLSPTGCDSKGFRRLMRKGERGVIALGVFQGLCQLMGTLPKEARKDGKFLNSDGSGMDVADLWEMTRMQVANPLDAINDLKEVGWLVIEDESVTPERATNLPPSCHPHAAPMPENSGFVQGEGEEQEEEEDPQTPKGGIRKPVDLESMDPIQRIKHHLPAGAERWSASRQKQTRMTDTTPLLSRIGSFLGRRPTTLWTVADALKVVNLNPQPEELDEIEEFYKAHIPKDDFRRTSIETLLNNWNGEGDKARLWKADNN